MATIAYLSHSAYLCGGTRILAEHAVRLAQRGHSIILSFVDASYSWSWLPEHERLYVVPLDTLPNYEIDAVVISPILCLLSKEGRSVLSLTQKRFLLVQGNDRLMWPFHARFSEEVYRDKSVRPIVISGWLRDMMRDEFGRDDVVYAPNKQEIPALPLFNLKPVKDRPVVLVEGNANAPAKGVAEAWIAIQDLPCDKWLLTNSPVLEVKQTGIPWDAVYCQVPWLCACHVIRSADIMLKPSHAEGCPTPHMEAMALGTALVTTNCRGTEEYCIGGLNCKMVGVGDVVAMRATVNSLLKDARGTRYMAEKAKLFAARHFGWKGSIDAIENAIVGR